MPTSFPSHILAQLQASFLAIVLPRVLSHGRVSFRHIKCRDRRADAIHEMIGLAWLWHLRLAEKGKDATCFPTVLASYAARAVKCGHFFCGKERAKDVLSPLAQREQHFSVEKLPEFSTLSGNPLEEALHDNTVSPVPDQVVFRLDFPSWLGTLGQRNRATRLAPAAPAMPNCWNAMSATAMKPPLNCCCGGTARSCSTSAVAFSLASKTPRMRFRPRFSPSCANPGRHLAIRYPSL